ncbi:Uncharacterised protein [Vibrio cholerae]|nr:Uncharacterised protein [Vibrio cholerae]
MAFCLSTSSNTKRNFGSLHAPEILIGIVTSRSSSKLLPP